MQGYRILDLITPVNITDQCAGFSYTGPHKIYSVLLKRGNVSRKKGLLTWGKDEMLSIDFILDVQDAYDAALLGYHWMIYINSRCLSDIPLSYNLEKYRCLSYRVKIENKEASEEIKKIWKYLSNGSETISKDQGHDECAKINALAALLYNTSEACFRAFGICTQRI
jgi:hypothetical protein